MPKQSYQNYARRKPYRPNTYNYSSTAYEYYPAHPYPYYDNPTVQPKKKKAVPVYKTKEENTVSVGKICIGFVVFFVFMLISLFSSIQIVESRNQITQLTEELEAINETNSYLEAELNKCIDLTEIEQIATTKLSMQHPTKYQTIYIDVPKDSYTIQYTEAEDTDSNKLSKLINQITSIFKSN